MTDTQREDARNLREDTRNLRDQANALHAANTVNAANAGNNLAIGVLLLLAVGAIAVVFFITQTNTPTPTAPPVIEREINNTETNNTTIERERTQELVPIQQQPTAPEAPSRNTAPDSQGSN